MKLCGPNMQVILPVHGREISFSEQELISILENHFSSEEIKNEDSEIMAEAPVQGKWFEVKPLEIRQSLFQKQRVDVRQERTRILILEAFLEVKMNPRKYGRNFKTKMPKKTWDKKSVKDLKKEARKYCNSCIADWVEQALEWAQRIDNGESWESLCNKDDTAEYMRLVVWKNGSARIVGGGLEWKIPPSDVFDSNYPTHCVLDDVVPLVVSYPD